MQPWPTAYTFCHHKDKPPVRLMILKGKARQEPIPRSGRAREIQTSTSRSPVLSVLAGDGNTVEVLQIQPACKKRMAIADFLRGHPPLPGDFLGRLPQS